MSQGNPNPSPLTRFKPGISGNPSGRPKTKPIADAYRRILLSGAMDLKLGRKDPNLEKFAKSMIKQAIKGNVKAAAEITNRIEGPVGQHLEVSVTHELDSGEIERCRSMLNRINSIDVEVLDENHKEDSLAGDRPAISD